MASTETTTTTTTITASNGGSEQNHHTVLAVEMAATGGDTAEETAAMNEGMSNEITPLLAQSDSDSSSSSIKPKINIFSVSYRRRRPREQITRLTEAEISTFSQYSSWVWGGSRYSGVLCMALSSIVYCTMEALSDTFSAQQIPLFESVSVRCSIVLALSYLWLRKNGQLVFGPAHARKLLLFRAIMGFLSLLSFIYCIQSLPLSQAVVLSFTSPIMASIAARFILHEKLKISEIGGLACSFFGVVFIFQPILMTQGVMDKEREKRSEMYVKGMHHIYAVLMGLFSSACSGISYCLIRAAAMASDQPVVTVFIFGLLASPAAAICLFLFQEFVFPSFYSLALMLILGILAFLAQVLLARGLQLEKTSKVVNLQYLEVALYQLSGINLSRIVPSFGRLSGCLMILISVCFTMYFGPEKEIESVSRV